MPQYKAIKRGAGEGPNYYYSDVEHYDDIIVSPDKTKMQAIKSYTHEIVNLDPNNYQKIEHTGNDNHAHEFTSTPLFYKKLKDVDV